MFTELRLLSSNDSRSINRLLFHAWSHIAEAVKYASNRHHVALYIASGRFLARFVSVEQSAEKKLFEQIQATAFSTRNSFIREYLPSSSDPTGTLGKKAC